MYNSILQKYNKYIEQNPESIVKDYLDMFKRILTKKKDDKIIENRKQKEKNNQLKRNANQEIRQKKMEEKAQKNEEEKQIKQNLDSIADNLLAQQKISVIERDYYNLASPESPEYRNYIIKIQKGRKIFYLCFIQGYYIAYTISQSRRKDFYGIFIVDKTHDLQKIIDDLSNYFDSMMPSRNWENRTNKNFGMIKLFPGKFPGKYINTYYPSDTSKILDDATHLQRL